MCVQCMTCSLTYNLELLIVIILNNRPAKLFLRVVFATQMLDYEVRCIRLFRATYSECDTVTFAAPITGACCIAGAQHWASPELAMVLPVCAEPPAMQHNLRSY